MTPAAALAGLAGALAVAGAWEALAALEQGAPARVVARVLGPLRAAGRDGREPSSAERRRLAIVGAATLLGGGWLVGGPLAGAALAAAAAFLLAALAQAFARRRRPLLTLAWVFIVAALGAGIAWELVLP
jgi:tight adherence protein B